jgi:hypothetical protein
MRIIVCAVFVVLFWFCSQHPRPRVRKRSLLSSAHPTLTIAVDAHVTLPRTEGDAFAAASISAIHPPLFYTHSRSQSHSHSKSQSQSRSHSGSNAHENDDNFESVLQHLPYRHRSQSSSTVSCTYRLLRRQILRALCVHIQIPLSVHSCHSPCACSR